MKPLIRITRLVAALLIVPVIATSVLTISATQQSSYAAVQAHMLAVSTARQTYNIPCHMSKSGNWLTVRNKKRLSDEQLLADLNTQGIVAHGLNKSDYQVYAQDFSARSANVGPRNYGICDDDIVVTARAGTVIGNEWDKCAGNELKIDHGDGQYSLYAHLLSRSSLAIGTYYPEGTVVGHMGVPASVECGYSEHLHFEVSDTPKMYDPTTIPWNFQKPLFLANIQPNTPQSLLPANNTSVTVNRAANPDMFTLSFSWSDGGDPDNFPQAYRDYQVEVRNSDGSFAQSSDWQQATQWSVDVPNLGIYSWRVQSRDGASFSNWTGFQNVNAASILDCPRKTQGDANCNGAVDISDLSILALNWRTTATVSDFNGDRRTDLSDLSILARNFNKSFSGVAVVANNAPNANPPQVKVGFGRDIYDALPSQVIDVDVILDSADASSMFGTDMAVMYSQGLLEYLPSPDGNLYISESCRSRNPGSDNIFKNQFNVADSPEQGVLKITRYNNSGDISIAPGSSVCAGTLQFRPRPGLIVPSTGYVMFSPVPVDVQVVGNAASSKIVFDENKKMGIINIDTTVPVARMPVNISATTDQLDSITVTWTDSSSTKEAFRVYRSDDGELWSIVGYVDPDTTEFADGSFACSTTYFYKVAGYNSQGETQATNIVRGSTAGCLHPVYLPLVTH